MPSLGEGMALIDRRQGGLLRVKCSENHRCPAAAKTWRHASPCLTLTAGEDQRTGVLVHGKVVQLQLALGVYGQPGRGQSHGNTHSCQWSHVIWGGDHAGGRDTVTSFRKQMESVHGGKRFIQQVFVMSPSLPESEDNKIEKMKDLPFKNCCHFFFFFFFKTPLSSQHLFAVSQPEPDRKHLFPPFLQPFASHPDRKA